MSQAEEYDPPSRRDSNNATPRSSQNKSKILEATMRNVPKLKELNYTQWKNVITNSIKNAKLWGYVDGSIVQPSEEDASDLATYFDEAGAVRNAILGSLESGAQKYIEEALDPRDAWLTLEKKYLTADADVDSQLVAIEKHLADLRLEEGGDMIEHIAEFCRMRSHLSGTRLALDDQASISMLYRSLPPSYRQSAVTSDGMEMKDFGALCARLSYLSQNPEPQTSANEAPAEDHTSWGVPQDIKAFGLTGDKNPLLTQRAATTCRDCLLKDHKAGVPECPQYEWRKELWGNTTEENDEPVGQTPTDPQVAKTAKRLTYEFSEPVKVTLSFSEMGLKEQLINRMRELNITIPSAIQQCTIIPMINGRNVVAQAFKLGGKTTTLGLSVLQVIDTNLHKAQALVLAQSKQAATEFRDTLLNLTRVENASSWVKCYLCDENAPIEVDLSGLAIERGDHIILGTPAHILELIRRRLLQTRHFKILAVDNLEQVVESGFDAHILDVRRCLPCPLQTVVTFTTSSPELIRTTNDLMTDPIHISVNDNSVFFYARHFFLVLPATANRLTCIFNLRQRLKANRIVIFTRESEAMQVTNEATNMGYYGSYASYNAQTGSTPASQCDQQIEWLLDLSHSGSNHYYTLFTTDSALPNRTKVMNQPNIPLIHYHAPGSSEEYAKRLAYYGGPGKSTMIVTFITSETEEIRVIREIEKHHGIEMVELHWDGKNFS